MIPRYAIREFPGCVCTCHPESAACTVPVPSQWEKHKHGEKYDFFIRRHNARDADLTRFDGWFSGDCTVSGLGAMTSFKVSGSTCTLVMAGKTYTATLHGGKRHTGERLHLKWSDGDVWTLVSPSHHSEIGTTHIHKFSPATTIPRPTIANVDPALSASPPPLDIAHVPTNSHWADILRGPPWTHWRLFCLLFSGVGLSSYTFHTGTDKDIIYMFVVTTFDALFLLDFIVRVCIETCSRQPHQRRIDHLLANFPIMCLTLIAGIPWDLSPEFNLGHVSGDQSQMWFEFANYRIARFPILVVEIFALPWMLKCKPMDSRVLFGRSVSMLEGWGDARLCWLVCFLCVVFFHWMACIRAQLPGAPSYLEAFYFVLAMVTSQSASLYSAEPCPAVLLMSSILGIIAIVVPLILIAVITVYLSQQQPPMTTTACCVCNVRPRLQDENNPNYAVRHGALRFLLVEGQSQFTTSLLHGHTLSDLGQGHMNCLIDFITRHPNTTFKLEVVGTVEQERPDDNAVVPLKEVEVPDPNQNEVFRARAKSVADYLATRNISSSRVLVFAPTQRGGGRCEIVLEALVYLPGFGPSYDMDTCTCTCHIRTCCDCRKVNLDCMGFVECMCPCHVTSCCTCTLVPEQRHGKLNHAGIRMIADTHCGRLIEQTGHTCGPSDVCQQCHWRGQTSIAFNRANVPCVEVKVESTKAWFCGRSDVDCKQPPNESVNENRLIGICGHRGAQCYDCREVKMPVDYSPLSCGGCEDKAKAHFRVCPLATTRSVKCYWPNCGQAMAADMFATHEAMHEADEKEKTPIT